ncbi:MAG: tRNA guanosine(34) transglycosylase Tgt [Deltaproteobacteria bacterium]|nr:tRNA guanosine(34) transglycosylase Tgt [Deltaproteobacteria bacterium]
MRFTVASRCGPARTGLLQVRGQQIRTPAFMPVGTRAAVKGVEPEALERMGYRLILANTYHLLVRPGPEFIRQLGGLHRFMSWDGAILTDSGGFQAFSLSGLSRISEEGVEFRSHLDGSRHRLTPERTVEVQEIYGSDVIMPLDVCLGLPASREALIEAVQRTTRWLARSVAAWREQDRHALFGIVQGGTEEDLRIAHAQQLAELDLPGYAVGGLSVGEKNEEMHAVAGLTASHLPPHRPRYLMGVGTPEDLVACARQGIDLFDCVLPTRTARTGRLCTRFGDVIIKNARHAADPGPLDPSCSCETCRRYSRAYLRHLFLNRDPLAVRLHTVHNLSYYATLMEEIRRAIEQGEVERFLARFREDRSRWGVRKKG